MIAITIVVVYSPRFYHCLWAGTEWAGLGIHYFPAPKMTRPKNPRREQSKRVNPNTTMKRWGCLHCSTKAYSFAGCLPKNTCFVAVIICPSTSLQESTRQAGIQIHVCLDYSPETISASRTEMKSRIQSLLCVPKTIVHHLSLVGQSVDRLVLQLTSNG